MVARQRPRQLCSGHGRDNHDAAYHGLLIASLRMPLRRHVVLAKADATFIVDDRECPLFTNRWHGGAVDPQGHVHIESFRLDSCLPA